LVQQLAVLLGIRTAATKRRLQTLILEKKSRLSGWSLPTMVKHAALARMGGFVLNQSNFWISDVSQVDSITTLLE
jgi:hypothetical protein